MQPDQATVRAPLQPGLSGNHRLIWTVEILLRIRCSTRLSYRAWGYRTIGLPQGHCTRAPGRPSEMGVSAVISSPGQGRALPPEPPGWQGLRVRDH
jgi:hypothetical protein